MQPQPNETHTCPVEGCQELRKAHHLTCRTHWLKLPLFKRYAVLSSWQDYRAAKTAKAKKAHHAAWTKAAREAIAWLDGLAHRPRRRRDPDAMETSGE